MVSIKSLTFDESIIDDWYLVDSSPIVKGWADTSDLSCANNMLTLDFNPHSNNLPAAVVLDNLALLREDCKQKANARNACLLEHEVVSNSALKMIRVIEKFPLQPHGMAYHGTITLLDDASGFLVQLWCFESGITGLRDSQILDEFAEQGTLYPTREDWGGWMIDPYGFGKQSPLMHNVSEDAKYDLRFPDHPLSKVRFYLPKIICSLSFDPSKI